MTYLLQILLDEHDQPSRALLLHTASGRTCELLAPEAAPLPGPAVDPAGPNPFAAAVEAVVHNATDLHPAPGIASVHPSLTTALEVADLALASSSGRVPRTDLSPVDLDLFHSAERRLRSISADLSRVPRQRFDEIPAYLVDRRRGLAQVGDWLTELRTRALEPRAETQMPTPAASKNARLSALLLPAPARTALEAVEVYTLADVVELSGAREVLEADPPVAATVAGALRRAGTEPPAWLAELADPDRIWSGTRVGDLTGLSKQTKKALAHGRVHTVGDLTAQTRKRLLKLADLGPSRVTEIETCLAGLGMTLAPDRPKGAAAGAGGSGAAGTGRVTNVLEAGSSFAQLDDGSEVFIPAGEVRRVGGTLERGWVIRFDRTVSTGQKLPQARGVSLAVPGVIGKRVGRARDLLSRQRLEVVLDAPGQADRVTDTWRVVTQSTPAGTGYRGGAIVVLGVTPA